MEGHIHSIESFGAVDGPGVRFVVFFQGCPLRCLYCHNPDTWKIDNSGRNLMSVAEIMHQYNKNRAFYVNGGLTCTGGEPLLQMGFLTELFQECRRQNVHTCLDTSGFFFDKDDEIVLKQFDLLIENTNLVLLDIKHIDDQKHRLLTAASNKNVLDFAEYLSAKGVDLWIRHVVVPGYTDGERDWHRLGQFIGRLKTVKALDVLPYHTMGLPKYRDLKLSYPLEGIEPASKELAMRAKNMILSGMADSRKADLAKKNLK